MLTKTAIALSTVLAIGLTSAALAQTQGPGEYYADGTLIGKTVNGGAEAFASANAPGRHSIKPFSDAERSLFDRSWLDLGSR